MIKKLSVLIVDDEEVRHEAFAKNNANCLIDSAFTVEEGLSLYDHNGYDLIGLGTFKNTLEFIKKVTTDLRYPSGEWNTETKFLIYGGDPTETEKMLEIFRKTPIICKKIEFAWRIENIFLSIVDEEGLNIPIK